jgi:hypothetical protein
MVPHARGRAFAAASSKLSSAATSTSESTFGTGPPPMPMAPSTSSSTLIDWHRRCLPLVLAKLGVPRALIAGHAGELVIRAALTAGSARNIMRSLDTHATLSFEGDKLLGAFIVQQILADSSSASSALTSPMSSPPPPGSSFVGGLGAITHSVNLMLQRRTCAAVFVYLRLVEFVISGAGKDLSWQTWAEMLEALIAAIYHAIKPATLGEHYARSFVVNIFMPAAQEVAHNIDAYLTDTTPSWMLMAPCPSELRSVAHRSLKRAEQLRLGAPQTPPAGLPLEWAVSKLAPQPGNRVEESARRRAEEIREKMRTAGLEVRDDSAVAAEYERFGRVLFPPCDSADQVVACMKCAALVHQHTPYAPIFRWLTQRPDAFKLEHPLLYNPTVARLAAQRIAIKLTMQQQYSLTELLAPAVELSASWCRAFFDASGRPGLEAEFNHLCAALEARFCAERMGTVR